MQQVSSLKNFAQTHDFVHKYINPDISLSYKQQSVYWKYSRWQAWCWKQYHDVLWLCFTRRFFTTTNRYRTFTIFLFTVPQTSPVNSHRQIRHYINHWLSNLWHNLIILLHYYDTSSTKRTDLTETSTCRSVLRLYIKLQIVGNHDAARVSTSERTSWFSTDSEKAIFSMTDSRSAVEILLTVEVFEGLQFSCGDPSDSRRLWGTSAAEILLTVEVFEGLQFSCGDPYDSRRLWGTSVQLWRSLWQ